MEELEMNPGLAVYSISPNQSRQWSRQSTDMTMMTTTTMTMTMSSRTMSEVDDETRWTESNVSSSMLGHIESKYNDDDNDNDSDEGDEKVVKRMKNDTMMMSIATDLSADFSDPIIDTSSSTNLKATNSSERLSITPYCKEDNSDKNHYKRNMRRTRSSTSKRNYNIPISEDEDVIEIKRQNSSQRKRKRI
jgi:hypothetical protein